MTKETRTIRILEEDAVWLEHEGDKNETWESLVHRMLEELRLLREKQEAKKP